MANTLTKGKATVWGTVSGNAPQERYYPEYTSLAAKLGQFVYLSGGELVACATTPVLILGMLMADGQNTTAALYSQPVALANGDTIFSANKTDASGTVAAIALADVGKELGIYVGSNICTVFLAEGASAALAKAICIGLDPRDNVGDIGGRLLFMIKGWARQLFCTS